METAARPHRTYLRATLIGLALGALVLGPLIYQRFFLCEPEPEPPDFVSSFTIAHETSIESFTLSPTNPQNDEFGVRLISVAADGATEIEATNTSTHLTSTPGHPFASKEFGTQGLVLRTASSDTQTATFDRWSCRAITQSATK